MTREELAALEAETAQGDRTFSNLGSLPTAALAALIVAASTELARKLAAGDPTGPRAEWEPGGFIRQRELLDELGVSRATLWSWRRKGLFPEPVSLGPQAVAWRRCDVAAWRRRRGI